MLNDSFTSELLYVLITIIIGLSIHEAMHAFAAHWLGDTTAQEEGRLSLNPLRHIDPLTTVALPVITLVLFHVPILAAKPVPFNPARVKFEEFGSALVAAAGPLTNLVLAFIGALILRIVPSDFLNVFVQLNVVIFIFNLIPIPPLDGSRILYAFAPEPLQDFMRQIEPFGLLIVFALVISGVFIPLMDNLTNSILQVLP